MFEGENTVLHARRWSFSSHLVNIIEEHLISTVEYFGSSEEQEE
jgi:hypothetical protein